MKNFFFFKERGKRMNSVVGEWSRRDVLLYRLPSCPLSDHWECFPHELWENGNITVMLFRVTVFNLFDLYRLYSVVYFIVLVCFVFFVSLKALAVPYLTVKFCSNRIWKWRSLNLKCLKHRHWIVNNNTTSWRLLLLLLLDLKTSKSIHYIFFWV